MAEKEINLINQVFQSNSIILSDEWLNSCINRIKEEHAHYTIQELQLQVYEQWLLSNFQDVKTPILPINITLAKIRILSQSICLQILSVVDISKPKIQQIIQNNTQEDCAEQYSVPTKRELQLTLSDGLQEILAIEYKPVPCLNVNLPPGTKVRLNAPIMVKRGQIMLKGNSISVLSGKVEELLVSNASENIMEKVLKTPLNEKSNVELQTFKRTIFKPISDLNSIGQNDCHTKMQSSINANLENIDPIVTKYQKLEPQKKNLAKISSKPNLLFEEVFNSDEFDKLMQLEESEPKMLKKHLSLSPRKPISLQKLLKMKSSMAKGKFMIETSFKSIVEKFSMCDSSFSIKICVKDVSGEMDVFLHSDIISEMIGFNPGSLKVLKEQVQNKDKKKNKILKNALVGFKHKLINLSSKMELLLEPEKDPVIVKLLSL